MSARRSRSCSPIPPAIAEDALGLIEVDIEPLPAVADRHASAQRRIAAVRGQGHQSRDQVPCGARRCRRRIQGRALCPARELSHPAAYGAADGAARSARGMGRGTRAASPSQAAPRSCSSTAASLAKQMGLPESAIEIVENDVGGGFGARGEFYPEDFLIPFAARHTGRPVKWTEDRRENLMCAEPRARGGMRRGDRLHARRHDPRPARARLCGRRRLYAHQRRGRRAQCRAVHVGALSHPQHRHRRRAPADQQDAGRHLSRAWPLRDRFLPRAVPRHGGAGSRHRSRRVPPPQSRVAAGDAVFDRHHHAVREQGRVRQRRLPASRSIAASTRSDGRKSRSSRAS